MEDNNINTCEKSESISNLIQSIQSKLNNENDKIKPNENKTKDDYSTKKVDNITSNIDLGNILNMLGNSQNESNSDTGFSLGDIDPALFSKIQKVIVNLGKKDPKKDLLNSLKPFLRKSRQEKIGEYITILTLIKAFESFSDKGSDENE